MHKGDYHTDYSKYYDHSYKDKDLAYEHIKQLKQERRGLPENRADKSDLMERHKKLDVNKQLNMNEKLSKSTNSEEMVSKIRHHKAVIVRKRKMETDG